MWAIAVDPEHLDHVRAVAGPIDSHHSALEVLAYADDEAEALGRIGTVRVTITNSTISVDDDGRGTETRVTENGAIVRKPVMSSKDVRFYGSDAAPLLPDGVRRRGMSTVSAVSEMLVHVNHRESRSWSQAYRYGVPDDDLAEIEFRGHSGTTVTFSADDATAVDLERLRSLAMAFAHLDITFIDARTP